MAAVTPPTIQEFFGNYSRFEVMEEADVGNAIQFASRFVDDTWAQQDQQLAIGLLAAHVLTVQMNETESEDAEGKITSEKIGPISVTYGGTTTVNTNDPDWLGQTNFGKRYLMLLKLNCGGPVVI